MEIAYLGKDGADVETEEGILVSLDTKLTPELEQEGVARDLVRQIQELRKSADYNVDDRITVALINADEEMLKNFGDYIKSETLATTIEKDIDEPDQFATLNDITIKVKR